jgi:hypothetical protein
MGQKVVRLTEQDLVRIVKRVISEQTEETKFTMAVQNFLNKKLGTKLVVDGKTGPNSETAKAIAKYQSMINLYPADGVWGFNTWQKMPQQDKKLLNDMIAEQGGIIDRFINWLRGLL